jgi:apolipoprotein N-acyltransferase
MQNVALALASAALLATAARPWAPGILAWVAFVPLWLALARTERWPAAAALGWLAALGVGVVAFEGVAPAAPWAYPVLVAITSLPGAAASGLWRVIDRRLGERAGCVALPLLWTAADFLPAQRAWLGDFADVLTPIAAIQFDTPLRALAGWSSTSGVALSLLAVNVGVLMLIRGRRVAAASLVAVPLAWSLLPVPGADATATLGASLRVAVVQGAVPSVETLFARFDRASAARMLEPYAALTAIAAERGAELVVWGETVLPQALRPGEVPEVVAAALAPAPVALVGGVSVVADRSFNAVFHWQGGALTEVYRKQALVPVNEWQYTAGVPLPPLDVAGAAVGLGVCLDSLVPSQTRASVRAGAQLLVVVTEDGFAGRTVTPELHLRASAFRAIETGRWLVFANQSGPSAVIDARGRVVERLAPGARAGLIADVPLLAGRTPYVLWGDWAGALASVAAAVMTALAWAPRQSAAQHAPPT